jgi:hypothetical protein
MRYAPGGRGYFALIENSSDLPRRFAGSLKIGLGAVRKLLAALTREPARCGLIPFFGNHSCPKNQSISLILTMA